MKKTKLKLGVNVIIASIIVLGFSFMSIVNYFSYKNIIEEYVKNMLTLTSSNIQCEISNAVGMPVDDLQEVLKEYEQRYLIEAFLVDANGSDQIRANHENDEKINISDVAQLEQFIQSESYEYFWTKYIEELDWYLIVKKDARVLFNVIVKQWIKESIILIFILLIAIVSVNRLINRFKKQLIYVAEVDQLTGIYNRRVFDEKLERLRNDSNSMAILLIDIDNFKTINDTVGHIAGDRVIKNVAKQIQRCLEVDDIVARWGGDEFGCIVFGEENEVLKKLKEIEQSMNNHIVLIEHNITLSIGVVFVNEKDSPKQILIKADKALYQSKQNGRNQYTVYSE